MGFQLKRLENRSLTLLFNPFLFLGTQRKLKYVNGLCIFQLNSQLVDGSVLFVKEGSTVRLNCGVSGIPKPQVTWTKLNEIEIMGSEEVLELAKVREERSC